MKCARPRFKVLPCLFAAALFLTALLLWWEVQLRASERLEPLWRRALHWSTGAASPLEDERYAEWRALDAACLRLQMQLLHLLQPSNTSAQWPWPSLEAAFPTTCTEPSPPPPRNVTTGLPIYLLVVGAEGAGHHALEEVWKVLGQHYDMSVLTYDGKFHGVSIPRSRTRLLPGFSFSTIDIEQQARLVRNYTLQDRVRGKQLIIDARNSYPAGFGVGSLAHPDMLHLLRFDGIHYDFRVLVLSRALGAASISAINRFYDKINTQKFKNHHFQSRATEKLMLLVSNSLPHMPCHRTAFISYEQMTTNKTSAIATIAKLLNIAPLHVAQGFTQVHGMRKLTSWKLNQSEVADVLAFYNEQSLLWPLLPWKVSPATQVFTAPFMLVPRIGVSDNFNVPTVNKKRFLVMGSMQDLGLDNFIHAMQMGLAVANVLNRTLAFPANLRMRTCIRKDLCRKTTTFCLPVKQTSDGTERLTQCPPSKFFQQEKMEERGVYFYADETSLLQSYDVYHDYQALDMLHDPSVIVVDSLAWGQATATATTSAPRLPGRQAHKAKHSTLSNELFYSETPGRLYQLHFSCENIPTHITNSLMPDAAASNNASLTHAASHLPPTLNAIADSQPLSQSQTSRLVELVDFSARYGQHTEAVLYLHGSSQDMGSLPFLWSSYKALHDSMRLWMPLAFAHSPSVDMFARMLRKNIIAKAHQKTFICVHVRRGDFVTLPGRAPRTVDMEQLFSTISRTRNPDEPVYIATDDPTLHLNPLLHTSLGSRSTISSGGLAAKSCIYFWEDFEEAIIAEDHPDNAMLGWQDYVGLIEQRTCVRARRVVGTRCSALSGGLVNLRRAQWGTGVQMDTL